MSLSHIKYKKLVIIGKYQQAINKNSLIELLSICKHHGYIVYIEEKTIIDNKLDIKSNLFDSSIKLENINSSSGLDFAVVIGGDGTMIGIARQLCIHNIPLIGINSGRLGFITDINLHEISTHIPHILSGHYSIESRSILEGKIIQNNIETFSSLAINDIVVSRSIVNGMIELAISVNNDFMCTQRADGLIVSTATGSTAYALSVGGPILHPQSNGLVLAPIAPHSLSDRPIVIPVYSNIKIQICGEKTKSCVANFDMQVYDNLQAGDEIHIKESIHKVSFVHAPQYSYYDTLRKKLHWQEQ